MTGVTSPGATDAVLTDFTDGVLTVTLNQPDTRNALSEEITSGLRQAVSRAHDDGDVRAVVLTGSGGSFCAGGNVKGMGRLVNAPLARQRRMSESHRRLVLPLVTLPKPVVAALNGWTVGAGLSLALCADLRVAAQDARMSMAFVRVGLVPDLAALFLLPRVVGLARAKELAMLGDTIDAEHAREIGLVTDVVPAGELADRAHRLAVRLAAGPTAALALTKQALTASFERDLATSLELEAQAQAVLSSSDDHREGVAAFMEKRSPVFTGS